jgi:predicted PurR-regulated permease PerM
MTTARAGNAALSIIAILSLIALLRYAEDLFVPIVLSVLIAYVTAPLVSAVESLRLPRALAAVFVVLALLGAAGAGAYLLRHQATVVLQSLPEAAVKVRRNIEALRGAPAQSTGAIGSIQQTAEEIEKTAQAATTPSDTPKGVAKVQVVEPALPTTDFLWSGSLGLLSFLGQAVLVAFLVFFLLASGDLFKRKIVRLVGSTLGEKRLTVEALNEINTQIEHFLLVQILTSAVVAVCTSTALWLLGVNQPIIWGIAAGVFNSVPYFGAIIVSSGLALLAFLQFDSFGMAFKVALVALIITSLEGFLLTPYLMGRAARINGVAMFVSILFWSWLWGVFGMIVAVPIMMAIKTVCDRVEQFRPIAELLSER